MRNAMASILAWIALAVGTTVLFFFGLVILLPLSFVLEGGSGGLLHGLSRFWAWTLMRFLPFWDVEVQGLERVRNGKPYVVVSNHQSMLDIMILLAKLPLHFKFIAKQELFWIPFFGWHLALARYIPLKRGNEESGRRCLCIARRWLARGVSVVFFPEGTRSPDGRIHEFKAGAFKLALEEGVEILPLVIHGTRDAIPKYSWQIEGRFLLRLKILDPYSVNGKSIHDLDSVRTEIRERIVTEFERIR